MGHSWPIPWRDGLRAVRLIISGPNTRRKWDGTEARPFPGMNGDLCCLPAVQVVSSSNVTPWIRSVAKIQGSDRYLIIAERMDAPNQPPANLTTIGNFGRFVASGLVSGFKGSLSFKVSLSST
jgi:hypothetical protein